MRTLRFLFLLGLLPAGGWAQVDLVRVWPSYRTAESFQTIREFFGGEERTGNQVIRRTRPEERGGFYWLLRVRSAHEVPDAVLELQVIRPGQTEPEVHRFPLSLQARSQPILAGLTGADWADAKERPTAWQVRLLDAAGAPLATEQSFLWSAPAAPPSDTSGAP